MKTQHCLILMCGLPATGKSTLCQQLVQQHRINNNTKYICFDELCTIEFDAQEWKQKQSQMYQQTETTLLSAEQNTLVLVDDNFYYDSMRHLYYVLARKLEMSLGYIFITAPLETCLNRNKERTGNSRVPDHVIHQMHDKFEYSVTPLTIHTLTIDNNDDACQKDILDKMEQFIQMCWNNPLIDNVKQLKEKQQKSRSANKKLVHQVDIALRKILSHYITEKLMVLENTSQRKNIMHMCAKQRKIMFDQLKNGTLLPYHNQSDEEFTLSIESDLICALDQILHNSSCILSASASSF
jgi:tRNA uridine 5-carbamoylmethylation protein Kti12